MTRKKSSTKILYGIACLALVFALICGTPDKAFAAFTDALKTSVTNIEAATYTVNVEKEEYNDYTHTLTLKAEGTASTGFSTITIGDSTYYTDQIAPSETFVINIKAEEDTDINITSSWGKSPLYRDGLTDELISNGDTIVISEPETNPFAGKKISIMGDSISTYTGWSDADPITDESCTNRYGEAYYGPEGGDFHNTALVVEDTWWHQAAEELGAEILRVNSGNSTGLLKASYPANAAWDLYLKEMLMYKSRPYYLGKDGVDPDIIALYVGSNEVARASKAECGSVEAIDFDTLIVENEDGTYTYAEPKTVAESYCILIHKISVTYPDAEVYCFKVVPSAGGYLSTVNKRIPAAYNFNAVVEQVAKHYNLPVVDLMEGFQLDPDHDGLAVQEDFDRFQTYFNGDPHPNAAGFDVITETFVKAVKNHHGLE